ncbi:LOW QUALITY PROTEIN: inward rectifier potassium channel 13 [Mobula hypostoma]|uniref:LOW QUALITY PROTEIN: inward rectifier potassium channel 13 n=1 Tax=Mobula hypostoma TaxID=723540 RepID=UPI002FC32631
MGIIFDSSDEKDTSPLIDSRYKRIVTKDGHRNLKLEPPPPRKSTEHLEDTWSILMAIRWHWMLLAFSGAFVAHWLFFACFWYLLAYTHGDLVVLDHNNSLENHTICVKYIDSFTAASSFLLETQLTVGCGTMYPDSDCPAVIALLAVQMLLGLMMEALITGVFVAKIAKPKLRTTIKFSYFATVAQHEGEPCLMFRIANMWQSSLTNVKVTAILYKAYKTKHLHQTNIDFRIDYLNSNKCPYLIFLLMFYHTINQYSPFYPLIQGKMPPYYELVIFLSAEQEGIRETCQKRTSYIPEEIKLNQQFAPVISCTSCKGYKIDLDNFDKTIPGFPELLNRKYAKENDFVVNISDRADILFHDSAI